MARARSIDSRLLRCSSTPLLICAAECAVLGVAEQQRDIDQSKSWILEIGFCQLVAHEVHFVAKVGSSLLQPALKGAGRAAELGADHVDVWLTLVDGAGNRPSGPFNDLCLARKLRQQPVGVLLQQRDELGVRAFQRQRQNLVAKPHNSSRLTEPNRAAEEFLVGPDIRWARMFERDEQRIDGTPNNRAIKLHEHGKSSLDDQIPGRKFAIIPSQIDPVFSMLNVHGDDVEHQTQVAIQFLQCLGHCAAGQQNRAHHTKMPTCHSLPDMQRQQGVVQTSRRRLEQLLPTLNIDAASAFGERHGPRLSEEGFRVVTLRFHILVEQLDIGFRHDAPIEWLAHQTIRAFWREVSSVAAHPVKPGDRCRLILPSYRQTSTGIDMLNNATDLVSPATVSFNSGGERCRADYYRPLGAGPFPIIVMAHGLGGTRTMRLPTFAERFAAAGYAALVFDYRHFGDSDGSPRQLLDIDRQLADWKAAVAYASGLEDIDPARIVLWGTSFGGGHVLSTAANDARIAAVISQCPFTDGFSSAMAMDFMTSLKVTALALRDRIGSWFGAQPVTVALSGLPGEMALMNAPDAYAGYLAIKPADLDVPNYVAARFALDIIRYYPGRRTPQISCPILFAVCDPDTVAPAPATLRHAARAPNKEIKLYPDGHFGIYVGDAFERVVSDQIDFLKRNVPVQPTSIGAKP